MPDFDFISLDKLSGDSGTSYIDVKVKSANSGSARNKRFRISMPDGTTYADVMVTQYASPTYVDNYIYTHGGNYFITNYVPMRDDVVEMMYEIVPFSMSVPNTPNFVFGSRTSTTSADQFVLYQNRRFSNITDMMQSLTFKRWSNAVERESQGTTNYRTGLRSTNTSIALTNFSPFSFSHSDVTPSPSPSYPMYLFNCNTGGSATSGLDSQYTKFYYFRVFRAGILHREFIPFELSGVPKIKETVTGTYMTRVGNGVLLYNRVT